MIKYVSKFAMDILPSVAATIIGAYIVNHYITAKPGTDAPIAAAVSSADPKKVDLKADAKPSETSSDVANLPEAGVRAKGIKAIFEKPQAEKPQDKSQDKSADKPAETASIPVDTRRHQPPALREKEKTAIRTIPLTAPPTVPPATSAAAPVVAAPNAAPAAPAVEAAIVPEERRDANDLARAAIERLRGGNDGTPRAQDAVRIPDATRVPDPPRIAVAPPVRPLPPPIMVSTSPSGETFGSTVPSTQVNPPNPTAARIDDPRRPVPPADIPDARPLDLQAEASETPPPPARQHTTVAQDVLSAAKSVFHSVLPQTQQ
jgi:hypothetical protein